MASMMEPPELPRAVLAGKGLDDSVATGVLVQEIRAIKDDVVDHDPDAAGSLVGFEHDVAGDEGEVGVG